MAESPWQRLYRLVEQRRARLGLTQARIQATGGPSPATLREKLPHLTGAPTPRQRPSIADPDRALLREVGTSWGLVDDDRSRWNAELLLDEEETLVGLTDDLDTFGLEVADRLRLIPAGPERDDVMGRILVELG